MPEPKKRKRSYDAPLDSQVAGLRLVRQQRPLPPRSADTDPTAPSAAGPAAGGQAPEPELVSKLIDFIKKI